MTARALDGVRVVDLTRYIPGPYCTMLLGDLGADVVKVEEPGLGDPTRALPPAVGSDSAVHASLNRNKRSIAVDIRTDAGAALVRRLAGTADVLVEAFRPGVMERRGLGPRTLHADNPRLVYCSLTGYGREGPQASRAGHDVNYAARGGFLAANRDEAGRSVLPGAQVADMTGGLLAVVGILAALQARERTGRGQVVDVSLLDGVLGLMTLPLTRLLAGGEAVDELSGAFACYRVYRCRDGLDLAVGALEPKFWERLCRALDLPEHAGRQWAGGARRVETIEAFAAAFAARDRADWLLRLSTEDVCVEPVLEPLDAAEAATRSMADQRAGGGALRTVATPLRLADTPAAFRREPPGLGQHTGEVLAEAGFTGAEIDALRGEGVLA
ncbi:MAG TPA: CaiB/BaiF CoA-transferase family protein [Vicinamibacteria bacterium]|nr:CaiB/BaiF CoA-transferase family protein [Vicinamibacteria bacterium]